MPSPREYPERPIVGVGGVLIENGKALLIRRGSEPLLGQWSIPGGTLELGETLLEGVAREMLEETAVTVRVLDLIEVFERISPYSTPEVRDAAQRPQFHFVIVDYLCEKVSGEAKAGSPRRTTCPIINLQMLRRAFCAARLPWSAPAAK